MYSRSFFQYQPLAIETNAKSHHKKGVRQPVLYFYVTTTALSNETAYMVDLQTVNSVSRALWLSVAMHQPFSQTDSRDSSCLHLLASVHCHPRLRHGFWSSASGPQACSGSTVPTELPPCLSFRFNEASNACKQYLMLGYSLYIFTTYRLI